MIMVYEDDRPPSGAERSCFETKSHEPHPYTSGLNGQVRHYQCPGIGGMMQCEDTEPHEAHTWWYERVVLDLAASIEYEEPIGTELCTHERCEGKTGEDT